MTSLKNTLGATLFFALVFIASCITFNNNSLLDKYDYDNAVYGDNINAFNGFTVYEAKNAINKQNQFIFLFKQNKLRHILSNNPRRNFSYNYIQLEDNIHLLYTQNRNRFERGGGVNISEDSIVCYKNIILKKYRTYGGRYKPTSSYIIFKKEKNIIQQFVLKDTTTNAFTTRELVRIFADNNEKKMASILTEMKNFSVQNELMLQQFFKTNVLSTQMYIK